MRVSILTRREAPLDAAERSYSSPLLEHVFERVGTE